MTTVKSWFFANTWTFALQNVPSIYQFDSDFVKHLFRIQIQKGGRVLLWNQVKSKMEACYSELVLVSTFKHPIWRNLKTFFPMMKVDKKSFTRLFSWFFEHFSSFIHTIFEWNCQFQITVMDSLSLQCCSGNSQIM